MQKTLRFIAFLLLTITFSCEDQTFVIQCSDCTEEEPVTASLTAELDPDLYYGALVQIWEGNLEDSIEYGRYTVFLKTFTEEVSINKKYTVTATYHTANDKYVAVDSATPRVKYDKTQCDQPCYFLYDRKCNLKLKYTR